MNLFTETPERAALRRAILEKWERERRMKTVYAIKGCGSNIIRLAEKLDRLDREALAGGVIEIFGTIEVQEPNGKLGNIDTEKLELLVGLTAVDLMLNDALPDDREASRLSKLKVLTHYFKGGAVKDLARETVWPLMDKERKNKQSPVDDLAEIDKTLDELERARGDAPHTCVGRIARIRMLARKLVGGFDTDFKAVARPEEIVRNALGAARVLIAEGCRALMRQRDAMGHTLDHNTLQCLGDLKVFARFGKGTYQQYQRKLEKKTVVKEAQFHRMGGVCNFFVPSDAENIKCTYEVKG
jgi:hypothetical protein